MVKRIRWLASPEHPQLLRIRNITSFSFTHFYPGGAVPPPGSALRVKFSRPNSARIQTCHWGELRGKILFSQSRQWVLRLLLHSWFYLLFIYTHLHLYFFHILSDFTTFSFLVTQTYRLLHTFCTTLLHSFYKNYKNTQPKPCLHFFY